MTHEETARLLTLIKGNWFKQPADDLTIAMWKEILGDETFNDCWIVALNHARNQAGEPPTAGQIFAAARAQRLARESATRNSRLRIEGPMLTPKQALADREDSRKMGIKMLADIQEYLEKKYGVDKLTKRGGMRAKPLPKGLKED